MKKDITNLFYCIDDFTKGMEEEIRAYALSSATKRPPTSTPGLHESEIMTIILMFHEFPCRNFKFFYSLTFNFTKPNFLLCQLMKGL